jgi:hypothetical protein
VAIVGTFTFAATIATALALLVGGAAILMCGDDNDHVAGPSLAGYLPAAMVALIATAGVVFVLRSLFRWSRVADPGRTAITFAFACPFAWLTGMIVTAYLGFTEQSASAPCLDEHPASVPSWLWVIWVGVLAAVLVSSVVRSVRSQRRPV